MQILGIILIFVIIALYFLWLRFQRKQEAAVFTNTGEQQIKIVVKGAYNPNVISIKVGKPVKIIFDRQEAASCSRFVTFEKLKIRKDLPPFAQTEVKFTLKEKGEISFTCDMGMYQGKLIIN